MTQHSDAPNADPAETPPSGNGRKTLYQRGAILAVAVVAVAVGAILIFSGGGSGSDTVATDQLGAPGPQGAASPTGAATTASATASAMPSATVSAATADPCSIAASTDPTYKVAFQTTPNPPVAEGTLFKLAIEHGGKPVTGATVCMSADMTTMHHGGVEKTASETSAGHYQLKLELPMRGPWAGSAVIVQPGMPAVAVPVSFNVD